MEGAKAPEVAVPAPRAAGSADRGQRAHCAEPRKSRAVCRTCAQSRRNLSLVIFVGANLVFARFVRLSMDTTYHYRLSRLVRTQSSEIFLIWDEDRRIGQLDLHFAIESRTIHATLVLEADLPVTVEEELLAQIDDDIVSSYLPSFEREDFSGHSVSWRGDFQLHRLVRRAGRHGR